ncbi:MAG: phenylalanine--tRNA ligase subunit alpha [Thermoprotei archaeon ex4572_64]|nr:MAG: phenylalanine--tRNA ligase subunit alpha [Thermoprotei archaeon ex4572_64]
MNEVKVSEVEWKIIEALLKGKLLIDEIAQELETTSSSLMRIIAELESKGVVKTHKEKVNLLEITSEGLRYVHNKLPELRVLEIASKAGELFIKDIEREAKRLKILIDSDEIKIALSNLVKTNLFKITNGKIVIKDLDKLIHEFHIKQRLLEDIAKEKIRNVNELKDVERDIIKEFSRRGLVKIKERSIIKVELTSEFREMLSKGLVKIVKVVTSLTSEHLRSGLWREITLKRFDLSIPVPIVLPNVPHFMELFIDYLREIFVSLGFEEVKGPYVELEFWNFDALFQAQDHPAREIHDTYYLKYPERGVVSDEELIRRVSQTHENGWLTGSRGWGYSWSVDRALKLILRTQTTAVSARVLYERGDGEYRVFTIDKVFRPEVLDPKHSMEFYQADGIVVGKNVKFKHLLGILEEIARKVGIKKVMFKPAYFPFTCPSAEGYAWHEKLGWVEFVGSGIFRPEVVMPLGIKECKVLAFGFGVDRLAMLALEIDDIRELYTKDINKIKQYYARIVKFCTSWRF